MSLAVLTSRSPDQETQSTLAPTRPAICAHLASKVLERATYRRVQVNFKEWLATGEWERIPLAYWGTHSLTDVTAQRKYLDKCAWPVGDAELARQYLAQLVQEQAPFDGGEGMASRRVPWQKRALPMFQITPPLYFKRPVDGDLAYVDIHAAYHTLYSPATLDLDFDIERGTLALGRLNFLSAHEIGQEKGIRNSLVGITRALTMQQVRFGIAQTRRTHNRFLAPGLWGYLMHTMHAIARQAVRDFGAVYVHTDGYIVPRPAAEPLITHLRDRWLMDAGIRHAGQGRVRACGAYRIGGHGTRTIGLSDRHGQPVDNMLALTRDQERLLMRWRHWLAERHVPQSLDMPGPTPATQLQALRAEKARRQAEQPTTIAPLVPAARGA